MTFEDTGRRTGYVVNVYGLGDTGLYEVTKSNVTFLLQRKLSHSQNTP